MPVYVIKKDWNKHNNNNNNNNNNNKMKGERLSNKEDVFKKYA